MEYLYITNIRITDISYLLQILPTMQGAENVSLAFAISEWHSNIYKYDVFS